jgi:homoserine dehydrogenase
MGDSEAIKVGLLGRGTVGGAFVDLVGERADAIAAATGKRPEIGGVLTTSSGDFEQILASSDVIVELIGGLEPARDYVLRALQAGKPVISANKALISSHGPELFAASEQSGAPLFFEAAVAGVIPAIRVIEEPTRPPTSAAATRRRRWRSSRAWPSVSTSRSTRSPSRASRTSPPTTSPTRRSSTSCSNS